MLTSQASTIRALIVEDNRDICGNIAEYLESQPLATYNYVLDFAYDGVSALHLATTARFDVLVLDLTLPKLDGLAVCQQLRADPSFTTPILMLTARDTLNDKLSGFTAGADDYLTKPFALQELQARLEALYKRAQGKPTSLLTVADLSLNKATLQVERAGQLLELTPAATRILQKLMEEAPAVVSREELETLLWADERPDGDALRSHLYKLRQIIDKPFQTALIHTVHKIGYRLAEGPR